MLRKIKFLAEYLTGNPFVDKAAKGIDICLWILLVLLIITIIIGTAFLIVTYIRNKRWKKQREEDEKIWRSHAKL